MRIKDSFDYKMGYNKGYEDGYENGRMSKEPVFFPPCENCNKKMDEVRKAYNYWKENQKTGHWISKPNIYGVAYCSECDYELHTNNTNYCPNCGAKMEGENNES